MPTRPFLLSAKTQFHLRPVGDQRMIGPAFAPTQPYQPIADTGLTVTNFGATWSGVIRAGQSDVPAGFFRTDAMDAITGDPAQAAWPIRPIGDAFDLSQGGSGIWEAWVRLGQGPSGWTDNVVRVTNNIIAAQYTNHLPRAVVGTTASIYGKGATFSPGFQASAVILFVTGQQFNSAYNFSSAANAFQYIQASSGTSYGNPSFIGKTVLKGINLAYTTDIYYGSNQNASFEAGVGGVGLSVYNVRQFTGTAAVPDWCACYHSLGNLVVDNTNTGYGLYLVLEPTNNVQMPQLGTLKIYKSFVFSGGQYFPTGGANQLIYSLGPVMPAADYYGLNLSRDPSTGALLTYVLARPVGGVLGLYLYDTIANTLSLACDLSSIAASQPEGLMFHQRVTVAGGTFQGDALITSPRFNPLNTTVAPSQQWLLTPGSFVPTQVFILTDFSQPRNSHDPISLSFRLVDSEQLPVDVQIQFSEDNTTDPNAGFHPATITGTTTGLATSQAGNAYTVTWNVAADINTGLLPNSHVRLKILLTAPTKSVGVYTIATFTVVLFNAPPAPRNTYLENIDSEIQLQTVAPISFESGEQRDAVVVRGLKLNKLDASGTTKVRAIAFHSAEALQIYGQTALHFADLPGTTQTVLTIKPVRFLRRGLYDILLLDANKTVVAKMPAALQIIQGPTDSEVFF
jgi:hypothetical protein